VAAVNRDDAAPPAPRIGLAAIFAAFLRLGATSFGGGTVAWLYRDIVQRRRWLDDRAFLAEAGLSQIMPGSSGVNLVVLAGQRLRQAPGALIATLGLLSGPLVIVLALAFGYQRLLRVVDLHAVLDGVAAGAVGLFFATGLRSITRSRPSVVGLAITALTVLAVGVLRWPMLPVVVALAPVSVALARSRQRRGRDA
jgi:chromate transporter